MNPFTTGMQTETGSELLFSCVSSFVTGVGVQLCLPVRPSVLPSVRLTVCSSECVVKI